MVSNISINESFDGLWDNLRNDVQSKDKIVACVTRHLILPVLYPYIQSAPEFSEPLKLDAHNAFQRLTFDQMRKFNILTQIVDLLRKENIEVLLLKGVSLANLYYGGINQRGYRDLDLLIDKKDFYRAITVLNQHDYKQIAVNPNGVEVVSVRDSTHIDFHFELNESHFGRYLSVDQCFKNKKTIDINGKFFNVLGAMDNFIFVLLHGRKHLWAKFVWLLDLRQIMVSEKFAAEDLKNILIQCRLVNAFNCALLLIELSGISFVGIGKYKDSVSPKISITARALRRDIFESKPKAVRKLLNLFYHCCLFDSKKDFFYYMIGRFKNFFKS